MYSAGASRSVLELEHALRDLDRVTVWDSRRLSAEVMSKLTGASWSNGGMSGPVLVQNGRTFAAPEIINSVDAVLELTATMGFRPGSTTLLLNKAIEILPRWTERHDGPLSEREALPVAMVYLLLTEEVVA